MKRVSQLLLAATLVLAPFYTWACSAAGDSKHIGSVTSVDQKAKKFTIKDAETQGPITFTATDEIIDSLKNHKGRVLVNFEKTSEGGLKATGVTF